MFAPCYFSFPPLIHKTGKKTKKQGVCHTMALPFTLKKKYLKAKEEELGKFKYFTIQKYIFKKTLYKNQKILQDIIITL
jgi:hypothetical protein